MHSFIPLCVYLIENDTTNNFLDASRIIREFMLISNTSLYFTFNKDSVCQIRRGSIDLSSFQYKWLKFQKWYQEDSDYESFSVSLHLSSTNLIYSATVFKSQKVIFVPLNATDG